MKSSHHGFPLSVYFQGRVYVVGFGEYGKEMEMLNVGGNGEWTILKTFDPLFQEGLLIGSMVIVGSELFVKDLITRATYLAVLESHEKRLHLFWLDRAIFFKGELTTVHLKC
ncbi:unnamed protein product [Hymenolepis diminuta]|uniref:Uncharacterized protein n=1 Tax=Hymenolepis diminuta TaxID=6216 RepID=A0A564ZES6_HYMDI|nr:unnamed protein product [Hymenolepis diminuta]